MSKISLIVPCYNVEKYLDRCMESILNQTHKDLEIILVDDGSPDRVPEMCDEYAKKDSRVKVVHKKNAGLGMACNSGIEVASGEYIAFCDSDDWVDQDFYAILLDAAYKYNSDMVISGLRRVNSNDETLSLLSHVKDVEIYDGEQVFELAKDMIASSPGRRHDRRIQVSAKTVLYKRSIIERNNIRFVSERIMPSEDLSFNISYLMNVNSVVCIPEFKYHYLVNPNSITANVKSGFFDKIKCTASYLKDIMFSNAGSDSQKTDVALRTDRLLIGEARSHISLICNSTMMLADKRRLTKAIYDDAEWHSILKRYPISQMPLVHRVFILAIKYKLFPIIYIITRLKGR